MLLLTSETATLAIGPALDLGTLPSLISCSGVSNMTWISPERHQVPNHAGAAALRLLLVVAWANLHHVSTRPRHNWPLRLQVPGQHTFMNDLDDGCMTLILRQLAPLDVFSMAGTCRVRCSRHPP